MKSTQIAVTVIANTALFCIGSIWQNAYAEEILEKIEARPMAVHTAHVVSDYTPVLPDTQEAMPSSSQGECGCGGISFNDLADSRK